MHEEENNQNGNDRYDNTAANSNIWFCQYGTKLSKKENGCL